MSMARERKKASTQERKNFIKPTNGRYLGRGTWERVMKLLICRGSPGLNLRYGIQTQCADVYEFMDGCMDIDVETYIPHMHLHIQRYTPIYIHPRTYADTHTYAHPHTHA